MRCPDCNKFVSYDEPECESNSVEISGSAVQVQVSVRLNCADCGGNLKDCEIDSDTDIKHACKPKAEREKNWTPDPDFKDGDDQFEIEDEGTPEGNSRLENKDRNGKPIKLMRYMKQFYGFTQEVEVKCRKCGEVFWVTVEGEEQASAFNECV